ncbi:hypothetical protein [Desulfobacter curvatus]|nr:hypothetical protein [Desulfobacter curvatus]
MKVKLISGDVHERGILSFVNDFDFKGWIDFTRSAHISRGK